MKLDSQYLSKSIGLLNPKAPKIVGPKESINSILTMLAEDSGGAVLICDKNEKILGIFTERDVLKKIVGKVTNLNLPIEDYMTKSPITVDMTSALGYALQLMSEGGFRHVPVIDDQGQALAVLSMKDVVDEIVSSFVLR